MIDDHERSTCPKAGSLGHWMCGVCTIHGCPRFECGCVLRMSGNVDGLWRRTPGTVRLALIFENGTITISPRDEASVEWLENRSGRLFCSEPVCMLAEHWSSRGVSRRDLPAIAAELQALIRNRYIEHAGRHNAGGDRSWYHPDLVVEVRACEYVAPPPTHLELREICPD